MTVVLLVRRTLHQVRQTFGEELSAAPELDFAKLGAEQRSAAEGQVKIQGQGYGEETYHV